MVKRVLIPVIIAIVIILGFLVAAFLSEMISCTEMGCPCENLVSERPCNSCTLSNPVFTSGIVHISKVCSAQEVILCENNTDVGRRVDVDNNSCEYKLNLLVW